MKHFLVIIISFLFLISCNSNKSDKTVSIKYLVLPDSLFVFKSLSNSIVVRDFYIGDKPEYKYFTDSIFKKVLVPIDTIMAVKLLLPLNIADSSIIYQGFRNYYFVSKQAKVGNIQPIIIKGKGDDYDELILLTLDSNNTPIDHYILYENSCAGYDDEDSLARLCPAKHSILKSNHIETYVDSICLRVDKSTNSITDFARIDSLIYEAVILPTGKIESKYLKRFRYNRNFNR